MNMTTCLKVAWSNVPIWLLILVLPVLFGACGAQPQTVSTAASPTPQASAAPQTNTVPNPPGFSPAILNHPYPATGVVKNINRKEGWIGINHEEIKGYMPAMEMEFWLKSPNLVDDIKVGDRIDFIVIENGKGQYVTEIKKR